MNDYVSLDDVIANQSTEKLSSSRGEAIIYKVKQDSNLSFD